MRDDYDGEWEEQTKEVLSDLKKWRQDHPKATLKEIEAATDERLDRLRSRLITDTAMASDAADWGTAPAEDRPRCSECQRPLTPRGKHSRRLQSQGSHDVTLEREYGGCPACGAGLFPPR